MEPRKSRRKFLGLAGAAASGVMLFSAARVRADDASKKAKAEKKAYQGTSKKANIQEALELAIQAAHKAASGTADHLVQWTLKEISGSDGGVAGSTTVTVTIEA
jgi:hypothetical protein